LTLFHKNRLVVEFIGGVVLKWTDARRMADIIYLMWPILQICGSRTVRDVTN